MDQEDIGSNPTSNRPFGDVLQARASRRSVLAGGLATAATGFIGAAGASSARAEGKTYRPRTSNKMNFKPVSVAEGSGPVPSISRQYQYDVLIPWGEPLEPGGPSYDGDPSTRPSAADQARMIGIGHDGMAYFPFDDAPNRHGMLCINFEYGDNGHLLGKDMPESLEDVRLSQHAHGVGVVEIAEWGGTWQQRTSDYARRIHVNTPVTFSGPVAGHALLQTPNGNIPLGTANNCASGKTPWGTYLTCEENFNGYFGATHSETTWAPTEAQARYGLSEGGFGYGWHVYDRRFDLSDPDYRNEENRFGWVVEIDPFDASQTPVKRTALGRVKHEGAEVVIGKGNRAVVYMGDDERFDYIYKFVSDRNYKRMLREGVSPLDEGVLYVARFDEDGTGEWLPLTMDNPALAGKFADQAEILVYARMAADAAGATPMDRPEWVTVAPDGWAYCALTNNSNREVADAANPLAPNNDGHIIRWLDADNHTGTTFKWDIFLIAESTHGTEDTFSDPDGLWADPYGRLFIETDGGQQDGLNDQLLIADTDTGEVRRLLTGVTGCEVTGIATTPNQKTLFCNIQHPGNGDPSATNFPAVTDGVTIPRDATLVVRRKNGGIVGS